MNKFILLLIFTICFTQTLTFQKEIQERISYELSEKEFEKRSIRKFRKLIVEDVVSYFNNEYNLIVDKLDVNFNQLLLNDLYSKELFGTIVLNKKTIIREKLYIAGEYYFNIKIFLNYIKDKFKEDIAALGYDRKKLKTTIAEIIEYRDTIYKMKKSNSSELLSVIKIGMPRQEVFNVLLYFNERRMQLDSKNSELTEDKKKRMYHIKNSYIRLVFDMSTKQLVEIIDLTPKYKIGEN